MSANKRLALQIIGTLGFFAALLVLAFTFRGYRG